MRNVPGRFESARVWSAIFEPSRSKIATTFRGGSKIAPHLAFSSNWKVLELYLLQYTLINNENFDKLIESTYFSPSHSCKEAALFEAKRFRFETYNHRCARSFRDPRGRIRVSAQLLRRGIDRDLSAIPPY